MSRKKNIFSMYRVLLLAVTLPLVAVLLGVTTASTKATSKEVKSLTKNYMLSIVEQCGSTLDSALFKGEDDTLSYNFLSAKANDYTVTDVDSSYLYIVDGHTAEMLYHPTKEKCPEESLDFCFEKDDRYKVIHGCGYVGICAA